MADSSVLAMMECFNRLVILVFETPWRKEGHSSAACKI
jgi:hypothetical protein